MVYLLFSILFSSFLFVVFKLFDKYNINTTQAIIINYFTAFFVGYISYNAPINLTTIPQKPWFFGALILSGLFISVFTIMALTSQKNGVGVASVAGKMSIVIPVIFGLYLYNEQLNFQKILGIILALCAVYLSVLKETPITKNKNFIYPFLLFLGSGIIDTLIKYIQHKYITDDELSLFSATVFLLAGLIGTLVFLFKRSSILFKNIIAGTLLGVINYYSIIFLLKALATKTMSSAEIFTINNVAIVMLTTLLGLFIFKEKMYLKNWVGILIAIISILLITL